MQSIWKYFNTKTFPNYSIPEAMYLLICNCKIIVCLPLIGIVNQYTCISLASFACVSEQIRELHLKNVNSSHHKVFECYLHVHWRMCSHEITSQNIQCIGGIVCMFGPTNHAILLCSDNTFIYDFCAFAVRKDYT